MSSTVETEVDIQSEVCDYLQYKQRYSLALLKRSGATFPKMLGKLAEQERAKKERGMHNQKWYVSMAV